MIEPFIDENRTADAMSFETTAIEGLGCFLLIGCSQIHNSQPGR